MGQEVSEMNAQSWLRARNETKAPREPMMTWSSTEMPMTSPTWTSRLVIAKSSSLGSGSPLG